MLAAQLLVRRLQWRPASDLISDSNQGTDMTKRAVLICAAILVQSGAAYAKPDLPPNVTTRPYKGNQAIDAIDYSFSSPTAVEFSKIKMCIATNLTNSEVQLRDNAGSFVGRSGTYYRSGNSSTVQGGAYSSTLTTDRRIWSQAARYLDEVGWEA